MEPEIPPSARTLARVYLRADRARRRLAAAADATWTGFWLGVMGRATLHATDAGYYDALGGYAGDAHNLRGLFDWEARAIDDWFPPAGRLLLVGAGGGRETLALARRGLAVEGYECHPALVQTAARILAGVGSAAVHHLARDAAPPAGPACDGAIVGWSAYMLVAGRARRIAMLRGIGERLPDGAPLLLSFFSRRGDERRLRIVRSVAGALRTLRRDEPVELGDDLAPNFVHRFTAEEIRDECAAAGFALQLHVPQGPLPHDSGYAIAVRVRRSTDESV